MAKDWNKHYAGRSIDPDDMDVPSGMLNYVPLDLPDGDDVEKIEDFALPILTRRAVLLAGNSDNIKDVMSVVSHISKRGDRGSEGNPLQVTIRHIMGSIDGGSKGVTSALPPVSPVSVEVGGDLPVISLDSPDSLEEVVALEGDIADG